MTDSISRRKFLQVAGAIGISAASVGFVGCSSAKEEPEEDPSTAKEYDVVIAGGGLAAMCATVTAVEAGAHVLIVEQQNEIGGNARYAVGCFNGANTKVQAEYGVTGDSVELAYEDFKLRGEHGDTYRDDAAKYYAHHAGETVDWLCDLGVEFLEPYVGYNEYPPTDIPRCYDAANGANDVVQHINPIIEDGKEAGKVDVLLDTHIDEIIIEEGAAVGVRADDGTEYRGRSVILAAGGFAGSKEMLSMMFDRVCSGGMEYNTGEGYRLALPTGALIDGMDFNYSYPGYLDDTDFFDNSSVKTRCPGGCVWVDASGNRLCDEYAVDSALRAHAYMNAENNTVFYLFNQSVVDDNQPFINGDEDGSTFASYLADGAHVFAADTLEELAEKTGINADNLVATIKQFNGYCAAGTDEEFGRTEHLNELTGPYYAIETIGNVTISNGGVVIDGAAQVLDQKENPIPGFFAAGEAVCCLEFFGESAVGGAYLTNAAVIGRLAGESAAAYALG